VHVSALRSLNIIEQKTFGADGVFGLGKRSALVATKAEDGNHKGALQHCYVMRGANAESTGGVPPARSEPTYIIRILSRCKRSMLSTAHSPSTY
jgi:hypothetical protein